MRTDKFNIWLKARMGKGLKRAIVACLHPMRNHFILFNVSNRAKRGRVNLDYWSESDNLGDTLSPVIVNYMLSQKATDPDKKVSCRKHLYAVGSVLTAGIQDCTVWGSGVLNTYIAYRLKGRKLDIRAVRGPMSMVVLRDYGYECPEVYGDPAIFMPKIYTPTSKKKTHKYGLVMHMDQVDKIPEGDILNIDIKTADYKDFIDKLCSVETVISSSLHGIILAESYGIKAVLLRPRVDLFKYLDWYHGTGRFKFPVADSIEDAFKITPVELPDLEPLREGLVKAFPYDLYE